MQKGVSCRIVWNLLGVAGSSLLVEITAAPCRDGTLVYLHLAAGEL